jgi:hypothetical protein
MAHDNLRFTRWLNSGEIERPEDHKFYALMEKSRSQLAAITVENLSALKDHPDRVAMLNALHQAIEDVLSMAERLR